jgi:hypothetical protein
MARETRRGGGSEQFIHYVAVASGLCSLAGVGPYGAWIEAQEAADLGRRRTRSGPKGKGVPPGGVPQVSSSSH